MKRLLTSSVLVSLFSTSVFAETVSGFIVSMSAENSNAYLSVTLDTGNSFNIATSTTYNTGLNLVTVVQAAFISNAKIQADVEPFRKALYASKVSVSK